MKLTRVLIIVILLSVFLTPQRSARADAAPPPPTTIGGLQPFEYQKAEVQMVYERVEINVYNVADQDDPTWKHEQADVTGRFAMRNQGQVSESMPVVFPLDDLTSCLSGDGVQQSIIPESFEVSVDGTIIPTKK